MWVVRPNPFPVCGPVKVDCSVCLTLSTLVANVLHVLSLSGDSNTTRRKSDDGLGQNHLFDEHIISRACLPASV